MKRQVKGSARPSMELNCMQNFEQSEIRKRFSCKFLSVLFFLVWRTHARPRWQSHDALFPQGSWTQNFRLNRDSDYEAHEHTRMELGPDCWWCYLMLQLHTSLFFWWTNQKQIFFVTRKKSEKKQKVKSKTKQFCMWCHIEYQILSQCWRWLAVVTWKFCLLG